MCGEFGVVLIGPLLWALLCGANNWKMMAPTDNTFHFSPLAPENCSFLEWWCDLCALSSIMRKLCWRASRVSASSPQRKSEKGPMIKVNLSQDGIQLEWWIWCESGNCFWNKYVGKFTNENCLNKYEGKFTNGICLNKYVGKFTTSS